MTHTLTYRPDFNRNDYLPSYATTNQVQSILDKVQESASRAQTLHGQALGELTDTFLDCRREDWDGYNALPVEDAAFLRAKTLLSRLINRFPAPTASATPHGSLTLEWIVNPRRRLMLSVDSDEQLAYAGVFGTETVQGVANFVRDVPQEISHQLSRLYYA
jgi:hypothetical protein